MGIYCVAAQVSENKKQVLLFPERESADPLNRVRVGADRWVGLEGRLRRSAHPLVVQCAGIMRSALLLLPVPQKWKLGFGLLVSPS